MTIKYKDEQTLKNIIFIRKDPDILFALSNIPQEGITVKLQGKYNTSFWHYKWYDMDVPTQFIKPPQTTVKFSGNTSTIKNSIAPPSRSTTGSNCW